LTKSDSGFPTTKIKHAIKRRQTNRAYPDAIQPEEKTSEDFLFLASAERNICANRSKFPIETWAVLKYNRLVANSMLGYRRIMSKGSRRIESRVTALMGGPYAKKCKSAWG
jgi:hypothetical protein